MLDNLLEMLKIHPTLQANSQSVVPTTPNNTASNPQRIQYYSAPNLLSNEEQQNPKISSATALALLACHIGEEANIFVDAGNSGAFALHYLDAPANGLYTVALGMGGMGYTFSAGIGASFAEKSKARPKVSTSVALSSKLSVQTATRRTYVLAGDGAFFMHGMEIHTAVEHNLPITFIIFDNQSHAMCHTRETLYLGAVSRYNVFKKSYIGRGLQAMFPDLLALEAQTQQELTEALMHIKHHQGPIVISIEVDSHEMPPFWPFIDAIKSTTNTPFEHKDFA